MSNSKYLALAAVVASAITLQPARAADMPMPYIPAPVVEEYGGWYLRGYIGMSNQQFKGLDHVLVRDCDRLRAGSTPAASRVRRSSARRCRLPVQ